MLPFNDGRMWIVCRHITLRFHFIGGNNLLDQRVAHYIDLSKGAECDTFNGVEDLSGLKET